MAEPGNTGLEADIGITLSKITRQLAQAEARMVATAKKGEAAFAASNPRIVASFDRVTASATEMQKKINNFSGIGKKMDSAADSAKAFQEAFDQQAGIDRLRSSLDPLYAATRRYESAVEQVNAAVASGAITQQQANTVLQLAESQYISTTTAAKKTGINFQNVGYQIQDFAVQVGSGTDATRALGQQLPQLLSGFGVVGVAIGTLSAVLVPLIGHFLQASDNAGKFADTLEAVKTAAIDTQLEIDKLRFGVDEEYQVELLREQIRLRDEYNLKSAQLNGYLATTTDTLDRQRIVTADLVAEIQDIVTAYNAAETALAKQQNRATQLAILEGQKAQAASEAADKQERAAAAAEALEYATNLIASVMREISAIDISNPFATALSWANGLVTAAAKARREVYAINNTTKGNLEWAKNGLGFTLPGSELLPPSDVTGGGVGSSGGAEPPGLFDSMRQDEERLTQQMQMLGKSEAAVAALTAKYSLLSEAKKRGLDLDAVQASSGQTLRQEIDAQAESIGNLTGQYEQAKEQAQFFQSAQDSLKEGFLDAIVSGESLAGVLEDVAKSFAKAALEAALFNSGPLAGGSTGGFLGGLFGLFGKASGGPVQAGQPYRVNEAIGSEVFVPSTSGAMLSASQAQKALSSGSAAAVSVQVQGGDLVLTDNGSVMARVRVVATQTATQAGQGAVQAVKSNLKGWNTQLNVNGAL